jgi:hypothetical protein
MILTKNFEQLKATEVAEVECDYCGVILKKRKAEILRGRKEIDKEACSNCRIKKSKEVSMIKYGTTCTLLTKEAQDKRKKTWDKKYGEGGHPFSSKEIRKKIKKTMNERYGDYFTRTQEYREKTKKTCQEKYGFDHSGKSELVKFKRKKTNLNKYGHEYPSQNEDILKKIFKDGKQRKNYGKTEKEIRSFLESITKKSFPSTFIGKKELDFYNESLSLAVEYCGLYFHNELSPEPRDNKYHYEKYLLCKEKNIRLITIFEDEWLKEKEKCKNFLKSILGIYEERIYGRSCDIKEIDKSTSNQFYEKYHLQNKPTNTKISFGLFFNNELIGSLSLGLHHRSSKQIVLNRLCFKNGFQVVGGASKLFKYAKNWCKEQNHKKIISWSDNRWSVGTVYEKLNFKKEYLPPDYSYVDLSKKCTRLSKQSQKKSTTGCPKNITERDWAIQNKLARIWDCGKIRWTYDLI